MNTVIKNLPSMSSDKIPYLEQIIEVADATYNIKVIAESFEDGLVPSSVDEANEMFSNEIASTEDQYQRNALVLPDVMKELKQLIIEINRAHLSYETNKNNACVNLSSSKLLDPTIESILNNMPVYKFNTAYACNARSNNNSLHYNVAASQTKSDTTYEIDIERVGDKLHVRKCKIIGNWYFAPDSKWVYQELIRMPNIFKTRRNRQCINAIEHTSQCSSIELGPNSELLGAVKTSDIDGCTCNMFEIKPGIYDIIE